MGYVLSLTQHNISRRKGWERGGICTASLLTKTKCSSFRLDYVPYAFLWERSSYSPDQKLLLSTVCRVLAGYLKTCWPWKATLNYPFYPHFFFGTFDGSLSFLDPSATFYFILFYYILRKFLLFSSWPRAHILLSVIAPPALCFAFGSCLVLVRILGSTSPAPTLTDRCQTHGRLWEESSTHDDLPACDLVQLWRTPDEVYNSRGQKVSYIACMYSYSKEGISRFLDTVWWTVLTSYNIIYSGLCSIWFRVSQSTTGLAAWCVHRRHRRCCCGKRYDWQIDVQFVALVLLCFVLTFRHAMPWQHAMPCHAVPCTRTRNVPPFCCAASCCCWCCSWRMVLFLPGVHVAAAASSTVRHGSFYLLTTRYIPRRSVRY